MVKLEKIYDNLDLKLHFGNMLVNVYYIRLISTDKGWKVQNHCHSTYEFHFIPKGRGTLVTDRGVFSIIPGTFYVTGPGIYHKQQTDDLDPMVEYCINFDFETKENNDIYVNYPNSESEAISRTLQENKFWFGEDLKDCASLFKIISDEIVTQNIGCYSNIISYTSLIITNSLRCIGEHHTSHYMLPKKTLDDKRRQLLDSFFNRYSETLSLKLLAQEIGMSIRQTERIIKKLYNVTFKENLIEVRIYQAKKLLTDTDFCLEKVATAVGISDIGYFCKVFKAKTGMNPTQYRLSCRNLIN